MAQRALALSIFLFAIAAAGSSAWAQRGRVVSDQQIVQQAQLAVSGGHVELYQHGMTVDPAFLKSAEDAYGQLENLIGRKLDMATLGAKIRIYVSEAVPVSHVWKGYAHPEDPKGIVFLNSRAYLGALAGTNATYIHEMAHLFTWRFHSHTLREGLADYLALKIRPGAGVGPNPDGYDSAAQIPAEMAEYLGTTRPPPSWVTSDAQRRRAYYYASYRLVKYLIEQGGMDQFMQLYDSDHPERDIARLYGASREKLVRTAITRNP
jgi:hypothetical protein